MTQKTRFAPSDFAGAAARLNRLLNACNRITQDLAELPANDDDEASRVIGSFRSALGHSSIPLNIYCDHELDFSPSEVKSLTCSMREWSAGEMTRREAVAFYDKVAEELDLDWCYAFAGISIRELSPDEQHELMKTVVKFGARAR
jgi:hypothetical protein